MSRAALLGTTVLIAAGGTGGHMFPALALAEALVARGLAVALASDARGAAHVPAGIVLYTLPAPRLDRGVAGAPKAALALAQAYLAARALVRRLSPLAAVGFGGYASFAPLWAAARAGVPTVIHEPNAHAGRANRWLARRARRIAVGFPDVAGLPPTAIARVVRVGNPVRPDVAALAGGAYAPPSPAGEVRLLVLGGSQGAHALAALVPAAVAALPAATRARLTIAQQCREEDIAPVRAAYADIGVSVELARFFDDVPARLAGAHLVISRAGASATAEIAAAGRPAILVPYPFAADDHQRANARALERAGAAWLAPQGQTTPAALGALLAELLDTPAALAAAATAAAAFAVPDAADRLAALVESLILAAQRPPGERAPRAGGMAGNPPRSLREAPA